ncbi:MAG: hypothetical protein Kow0063_42490 [Anaerolineae bacterium]
MKVSRRQMLLGVVAGALLLVTIGLSFWPAQPVAAQCGSQASSCKNCHETQGQMPVNTNGEWHTAHAFGDFCEFCHAGNVQATEKDEAHMGLVAPLADVKASCQSCHPTDFTERAQSYASTLGVEIGTGNSGGGDHPNPGGGGGGNGEGATGATTVSAPLGGEEIDFNLLYAEATAPRPLISNWGNLILALMVLGMAGVFFVTAWTWEGWGPKVAAWIDTNVAPIPQAVAAVSAHSDDSTAMSQALATENVAGVQALLDQRPELRHLLPRLMACRPETLTALETILSNPERGGEILQAIGKVDAEVVAALRKIGARDRNLLLALVKEI